MSPLQAAPGDAANEVAEPILNSPFRKPELFWYIREGESPEKREGRRPAIVFPPRDGNVQWSTDEVLQVSELYPTAYELRLVNLVRGRIAAWEQAGYPGATRTTAELLAYWEREGRERRLFFAQREAAKTIIFLVEARQDLLQGVTIPRDEPSEERKAELGYMGFLRYACKMATGSGKTTVMGMLAAWSILNKVANKGDKRFSDVVLAVCPNVTIRDRLTELLPERGDASIYRSRDLVPPHLMPQLTRGRVLVTNWHVFEPQSVQKDGARVEKRGVAKDVVVTIRIGPKNTTSQGKRYLTEEEYQRQLHAGLLKFRSEERDPRTGALKAVTVWDQRYVESDTALLQRVLGREVGGKQNILVLNDEAHHAYRVVQEAEEDEDDNEDDPDEELLGSRKEATVWIDGLDKINKGRGINFCVDLSATPYFLGRVGQETNRPFPWVVSDFGLIDAIESGLVKVPQLAARDTTGAEIPGYRNIWEWILDPRRPNPLTTAERGGGRANPRPEAILKYAHTPIAMVGSLWEQELKRWREQGSKREPVFILVVKNTKLAKVIFEWIAEAKAVADLPPARLPELRNTPDREVTIQVHTKAVSETDGGVAKSDEVRWMRFQLDTVGHLDWTRDSQGQPIYPTGFQELAEKLKRPLHPPGRDIRCIVSVGMLTEGWDCNTVTHIIGLRPFRSQLLCEQVVGRGLRRASYDLGPNDHFSEELATVLGVPFEIVPFKATPGGAPAPPVKRHHVHALPERAHLKITFPRVVGYTQAVRNRITLDWQHVPSLVINPLSIPAEVELKSLSITNTGRPAVNAPGSSSVADLEAFRKSHRTQQLVFELTQRITKEYCSQPNATIQPQMLFPQVLVIVERYLRDRVEVVSPGDRRDAFLAPWFGWLVEILREHIKPDTHQGEAPEIPRYEENRLEGSTADVDTWTSKDVRLVNHSHVNYVVADTQQWEQQAAYILDTHSRVESFVKNAGLGFAVPYLHNGQMHDYIPDFLVRFSDQPGKTLILETKGFDPLAEVKVSAAQRWVAAVNAEGSKGQWEYRIARSIPAVHDLLTK